MCGEILVRNSPHVTSELGTKWCAVVLIGVLSEVMLKEKLVELWPEYSFLYDVRSSDLRTGIEGKWQCQR